MSRLPLRSSSWQLSVLLVVAIGMCSAAGCQSAKKPLIVSGKVTYKGQTVSGGNITFQPVGEGSQVSGGIKPDGTFSFGGVPPGDYQIAIETESIKKNEQKGGNYMKKMRDKVPEGMKIPDTPDPVYVAIPKKYADPKTSGLTWNVTSGDTTKDFNLTD